MKSSNVAFIFLALTGCAYKTPVTAYFPQGTNAPGVSSTTEHSAEFLQSLHEPSLWELSQKDDKAEVYRLLLLRSSYHPVTVRLVAQSGHIYSRVGGGVGAEKPQGRQDYVLVVGQKDAIQDFAIQMNKAGFWNLSTTACADETPHWIFEGVKAGKYHRVDRCALGETDPLLRVGRLALQLSGLPKS